MNARRKTSARDGVPASAGGRPKASTRALAQVIERSSRIHGPAAEGYVARLRRAHPGASPAEIDAKLENRYLAALTASGAAVGSAATFPGVGTLTALSAGAGETVFFIEATALFVLAKAAVYNVPLGGAVFAVEVLLGSLALPLVLPALATQSRSGSSGFSLSCGSSSPANICNDPAGCPPPVWAIERTIVYLCASLACSGISSQTSNPGTVVEMGRKSPR